jgi:holo-[acyl-carrier protein] synthase
MIFGVGIDIIEVERVIEKIERSKGFLEKIFSKNEIAYCESKGDKKSEHYAVRFSAKEAFLKAAGEGFFLTFDLSLIEVSSTTKGKPEILLTGPLQTLMKQNHWSKIHLSLSHISTVACAVVIIETAG